MVKVTEIVRGSPDRRLCTVRHGSPMGRPLTFEEYRHLVRHSPVMIWRSGPDARCDYFNQTWLDYTRRTIAQELGGGGLGLGLFIARAIARAHGGSLDVVSADDATMFELVLPRHTPPARTKA